MHSTVKPSYRIRAFNFNNRLKTFEQTRARHVQSLTMICNMHAIRLFGLIFTGLYHIGYRNCLASMRDVIKRNQLF